MHKWLEHAIPHHAVPVTNPLFGYEVRRIRWGQSASQLTGYGFVVLLFVPFILASLWVLLLDDASNAQTNGARDRYLLLLLLCGIGANFILDMVSVASALDTIGSEMRAGRWESIRMTDLCPEQFIAAKYAAAQIRAWRVMALVVGLRLGLVAFMLIRIELLPTLFLLVGYCALYVLEPLLRVRALTAVGIVISSRIHNGVYALFASSVAILSVWTIQLSLVLLVCGWLILKYGAASIPVLVCLQPLIVAALGWSFYAFCRGLERWSLRHATLHIFRQD